MRPRGALKRGRTGDDSGIPCEFASFDETEMMEELDKAQAIWCSDDRTAPLRHLGLFDSCTLDDLGDFGISAFAEKIFGRKVNSKLEIMGSPLSLPPVCY